MAKLFKNSKNCLSHSRKNVQQKIRVKPGPASAVEELRTTEREDPGSTSDEGS
jgi:hypothetical protein